MIQLAILLFTISYAVDAYAIGMTIALAITGATLATASIGTLAIAFAVNMAVSFVVSKILTPTNSAAGSTPDQGVRLQVPPDPTRAIPIVYGNAYIGGKFVDAVLTTNGSTMYYVMAISCISDDGEFTFDKTKFYYGDRLITFDVSNPSKVVSLTDGAGNVDTKINGYLYIHLFRSTSAGVITNLDVGGTSAGSATPQNLMSTANGVPSGQEWVASGRQMNGLAFAIIKLVYNRDAETTQLQPVTFYAKHNLRSTGVAKPGDVWYDYMVNTIYGAAVDPAYVDYVSAVALNVYSDQLITFTDQSGTPSTQSRYRINGVLDTNSNVLQNVDQIMTACDSWMTYQETSGKWAVVVNKAEAASFAFNDSNIVGAITVGGMDITTSINQIEGRFPDGGNRDQFNYVYIETPAEILYPNEPVNKTTVNYDLVNNNVQAYYLANRLLEQAREDLNLTINTTYEGIQVNAGDVVSMTNSYYGWNSKLFRVMQVREASLEDGNLGAQIQLAEYSAAVYDNFDITKYTPEPNSNLIAGGYFSPLSAPEIIDAFPNAIVPNFDIRAIVPTSGRVTSVYLYYTTNPTPTPEQWAILDAQVLSNSNVLTPGSIFDFDDISLPVGNYYFAYKVGNEIAQSALSPSTTVFNWSPTGNTGTNAFIGSFSPSSVLVPFNGTTADFTAATSILSGLSSLGQSQYVTAATDSDGSFVANTWRIGGSATTGVGDISKTNITIGNPTVSGMSALFPVPTAMSASSAKISVPIRYKNLSNQVFQISAVSAQYVYAIKGDTGTKVTQAYLYQWSTSTPSNPNGTSSYNWSTGLNTSYTGGNGWSVTIPANPGTPGLYLWEASKEVVAAGAAATSTVDWTSGFGIASMSGNGLAGTQTATPTVFQWAATIPTSPIGTSTYTWSSGTFTPTPSGWSLTPGASPSVGFTLWGATVPLLASATQTTSSITWTSSSITARGYAGTNGATGTTGNSYRLAYAVVTGSTLNPTPATVTTSGNASYPPTNSWGGSEVWQGTVPSYTAGESIFQTDGIYNPVTDQTVWGVPYISALKVGSLSAISANLGTMTAGSITATMITSGTISADRIGSGSITAEKIDSRNLTIKNSNDVVVFSAGGVVGSGNIARNSDFLLESGGVPTYFFVYNNAGISVTTYTHSAGAVGNAKTWVIIANAPTTSTFGFAFSAVDTIGGWKPNTDYVVSFYARGNGFAGAQFLPAWNQAPASYEWIQNPTIQGYYQRYIFRLNYGSNAIDPNLFFWTGISVSAGSYLEFSAVSVEQGFTANGWSPPSVNSFNKLTGENAATYIADATIGSAQIANLAVGSAKIAGTIQSDNYTSTAGWQINKSGTMYLNQANVRGEINVGDYNGYSWPPAGKGGVHISATGILFGTANGGGKYFQVVSGIEGTGQAAIYTNIPAYIEDLQVGTLKIANSAVATGKIQANAVTAVGSSSGTGTQTVYLAAADGGILNIIAEIDQGTTPVSSSSDVLNIYINGTLAEIVQGNQVVIGNTGDVDIYAWSSAVRVRAWAIGAGTNSVTFQSTLGRYYTAIALLTQR